MHISTINVGINYLIQHQKVIPFSQTFKNNLHSYADEEFIAYLMCQNCFVVDLT